MNRLKSVWTYLSGINLAYYLILALVVKSIIADISYPAFMLAIPVLGYEGYKLFLRSKKPEPVVIEGELRKEMDRMNNKLSALTMERGVAPVVAKRYF